MAEAEGRGDPFREAVPADRSDPGSWVRRLFTLNAHASTVAVVALLDRWGAFEAWPHRSVSARELADRLRVDERMLEEALRALRAAGFLRSDPSGRRFYLDDGPRAALSAGNPRSLAGASGLLAELIGALPRVAAAGRAGGGLPASAFSAAVGELLDRLHGARYDGGLVSRYLPLAPGVGDRLRSGARVLDLGCGEGRIARRLAAAFPSAELLGVDPDPRSIRRAQRRWCEEPGAPTNLRFRIGTVERLPLLPAFDVVVLANVLHDLPKPRTTLIEVRRRLAPDGRLLLLEPWAPGVGAYGIAELGSAFLLGLSALYCVPVARAAGGEALGAAGTPGRARQLLAAAGYECLAVAAAPGNPLEMVITARPRARPRRARGGARASSPLSGRRSRRSRSGPGPGAASRRDR